MGTGRRGEENIWEAKGSWFSMAREESEWDATRASVASLLLVVQDSRHDIAHHSRHFCSLRFLDWQSYYAANVQNQKRRSHAHPRIVTHHQCRARSQSGVSFHHVELFIPCVLAFLMDRWMGGWADGWMDRLTWSSYDCHTLPCGCSQTPENIYQSKRIVAACCLSLSVPFLFDYLFRFLFLSG